MKVFKVFVLSLILVFISLIFILYPTPISVSAQEQTDITVNNYKAGSLIPLTSTDQPVIDIYSYKSSGPVSLTLYQADTELVLNSFLRNKDNKAINKIDVSGLAVIASEQINLKSQSQDNKVNLPFSESGIWVLRLTYSGQNLDFLINRSKTGVLVKNADNKYLFWAQNYQTKKASPGSLKIYSLLNNRTELSSANFDNQGIAQTPLLPDADIGVAEFGDDKVIFPINLHYLNTGYDYRTFKEQKTKPTYFIFTDRPVYKPGDVVNFKAVIRQDDDAFYSIPKGNAKVKVFKDYEEEPILSKEYPISLDGTVFGEYKSSADAPTGYYEIEISLPSEEKEAYVYGNRTSFQLQNYRKPEYTLDLTTEKLEFIPPEKITAKVSANYFFGQPVAQKPVKYSIRSSNYYSYEYQLDQNFSSQNNLIYGYSGNTKVNSGTLVLDKKGQTDINFPAKIPHGDNPSNDPYYEAPTGKNQVFSIDVLLNDGSGNPGFATKNVLVYAGEFDIYRTDRNFSGKINEAFNLPLKLVPHIKADVSNVKITSQIHRTNWIPIDDPKQKYQQYKKEEEDLPPISAITDKNGDTTLQLTPAKVGYYTFKAEALDKKGNIVRKNFSFYVSSDTDFYNFSGIESSITISSDKDKYLPAESAKLNIFSKIADADILLTFERGRVRKFQVIHLKGNSVKVEAPLIDSDIPNITAKISSFLDNKFQFSSKDLIVSAESKKVVVQITPDKVKYGPSETVQLDIKTTDTNGSPMSSDLAVWAVDKALYELNNSRPPDIFDHFWHERYNSTSTSFSLEGINAQVGGGGGGCFDGNTQILMADGSLKKISQINTSDLIKTKISEQDNTLVSSKVLGVKKIDVAGYVIINGSLRVTPEHKIWVNQTWKEAGSIQVGDYLTNDQGNKMYVSSVEWLKGKFTVYNLETEHHTFFADKFYVHNQKGYARTIFKDTAYWNPEVHTDKNGQAHLSFKLPDNLTTWLISAIADTPKTQVGQSNSEIVVTKDIFIRPVISNILRTNDQVNFSAIVHNFTDKDENLTVNLVSDSLKIEGGKQSFNLSGKDFKQIYWPVLATEEIDKATLTFSVFKGDKLLDSATVELPIRAFGFFEKKVQTAQGNIDYPLQLSPNTDISKAKITLDLSPTVLGSTISAFKYLLNYPYGCVEQTTSRLVPALIAKINPQLFGANLEPVDQIIKDSIKRLSTLQTYSGWGWWQTQGANQFVSSYVVEQLLLAKSLGYFVDEGSLKKVRNFLEDDKFYNSQTQQTEMLPNDKDVERIYGLTLLGSEKKKLITQFDNLTPDILSIAVLSNIKNGNKNADINGFADLMVMAKQQGDVKYFEAGSEENFGSNIASTAMAIRAMAAQGTDSQTILPFIKYITLNKDGDYYTNTFATSQVIQAIAGFTKLTSEINPNLTYQAVLDGKVIKNGNFGSIQSLSDIVDISKQPIANPSTLKVQKQGTGSLYSTLTVKEFISDRDAAALNNGLFVEREYLNSNGDKTITVGDTVVVKLTIGGLNTLSHYAVIKDELPAGLVPINPALSNETFYLLDEPNPSPAPIPETFSISDTEVTENGVILSLYQIDSGTHTYTYKARAVVSGKFFAPPAQAELMYNPKISGRSGTSILQISGASAIKQFQFEIQKFTSEYAKLFQVVAAVILIALSGFIVFRKFRNRKNDKGNP